MKNINVLIGLKRISGYKEQGNKKAPNPASIKEAETFINQTSAPMDLVKVGLNSNTGNPVLYFKKDFDGRNICSVEISDSYMVKDSSGITEASTIQEATDAIVKAHENYVEHKTKRKATDAE